MNLQQQGTQGDIRSSGPNGPAMISTGPENGYGGPGAEKLGKASQKSTSQASTAPKNKAPLPNTQESFIFPRPRRAKRKVYTTPSNGSVDWDEDLRPSDDGEKTEAEKDFDFTSVSSPSPSDSSVVGRTVGTARKKMKSATSRKGEREKSPAKRKKARTGKGKSKGSRLPLQPRGSSADNEQGAKPTYQDQKGHNESNGDVQDNVSKDDAGHEAKETESLPHTPQSVLSTHESVSPCKSGCPFMDGESEDGNLSTVRSRESLLDASVCWNSPAGTTQVGSNWNGIAKDCKLDGNEGHVEAKTKPNLRAKKRPGRGNELGQKLAAALLETGDNPDDYSLKNHGISPSNREDKQPEMSPQGDQDRVPQSELLSVHEVDNQQAELKPGDERIAPSPAERASKDYPGGEPLSATAEEANAQNGHGSEQEAIRSVSRKRAADDDQDGLPNKRHRTSTLEAPLKLESKGSAPQPHARPQLTGDKGDPLDPNPDIESSSWVTTEEDRGSEEDTQLDHPGKFGSEETIAIGSSNTPTTAGYSAKPRPKTIVDANGSPRLYTRYLDWQLPAENIPGKWQRQHSIRDEQTLLDERRPSWADYSDSDATEYYPLHVSTFRDRVRLYFGEDLVGRSGKKASSESESGTSTTDVELALSVAKGLRASPVGASVEGESARSIFTPVSTSALDTDALEAERGNAPDAQAPFGSSVGNPLQLESELAELHTRVEGEDIAGVWQTSLQAIQRSTDRVLLSTSQEIMRHVQHEREAINRVLGLYVQGCHRVLDGLFQAQEERIAGYRQQMGAVQEHQAGLCRGLMRRLERNQHRQ
ncbi:hypothetical protein PHISP_00515 [Aspergillus sp. HF37]|nr:hypothetical protein PHISP_00515 [Aspergillus sp. HF37]